MPQPMTRPRHDTRIDRILNDPQTYFAEARARTRAEVRAERAQERTRGLAQARTRREHKRLSFFGIRL